MSYLSKCLIFQLALSYRVVLAVTLIVSKKTAVHEILTFVNFTEADNSNSCEDSIVIQSSQTWGNVSFQKRSREQNYGGNWKGNKFRVWGNFLAIHSYGKDLTRKTGVEEKAWTFPHLRMSGLTKVSRDIRRRYQGLPQTQSETALTSNSAACGSLHPFIGGPLKLLSLLLPL